MGDGVVDEIEDVRVRDRVDDRLSHAPPPNQTSGRQNLEARRHRRDLLALEFAELAHVELAFREAHQQAEAMDIAHRAKHLRRSLELVLVWLRAHRIPYLNIS